ncbi:MAG: ATP-dependent DNA helicase RecQ [Hyphomicrobiaceae bacterium]|jgi:ATP-dependent DNA helicase RecQ
MPPTNPQPADPDLHELTPEMASPTMVRAQKILETTFGYKSFRGPQAGIVETVLEGNDALVLMPTGGGKSLCYQVPALVREGTAIVVSPLIALMHDQVDALLEVGVDAAFLNSTLDGHQQRDIEQRFHSGALKLLYVAPERLLQERTLSMLEQGRVSLFAIDEAHCVSQWGHDFRPEYRQLRTLHTRFAHVPRIALTATADERTRNEIAVELNLENAARFVASFDRPNIRYTIAEAGSMATKERLWQFIEAEHPGDAGIVYCLSRKSVEETAAWLTKRGRNAIAYHAGLPADVRHATQTRFLAEESVIVVATIAFGMGIDKPDVRFVAHLNLPKSIEAYYQETGRAGRDGEPANAWMAYGFQDLIQQRHWINQSEGSEEHKRVQGQRLDTLIGLCETAACRRQALLAYFGERLEQPCGNCDNCITPPKTQDGTVTAQKALSTVYRTGERFGVTYVVEVLTGKSNARITQNGHDKLSVYGIGDDYDAQGWRHLFRQLVAAGHLAADNEGHGTLQLTDSARPLLKGETGFEMRVAAPRGATGSGSKSKRGSSKAKISVAAGDSGLFEALKSLRRELAAKAKVPPYVICHDRTLAELANVKPQSPGALSNITGLGDAKIKRYGAALLATISGFAGEPKLQNSLSGTVNQTLSQHLKGQDANAIADERGLEVATIYGHLAEAIEAGLIETSEVLDLDAADMDEITTVFERVGTLESGKLGPAHAALDGRFDYGVLKCVLAELC